MLPQLVIFDVDGLLWTRSRCGNRHGAKQPIRLGF